MNYFITDDVIKYFLKYLKNNYLSESDLSDFSKQITDNTNNLANLQLKINAIDTDISKLEKNTSTIQTNYNTLSETTTNLVNSNNLLNENTINNTNNINILTNNISSLELKNTEQDTTISNLTNKLNTQSEELKGQQNTINGLQNTVSDLRADMSLVSETANNIEKLQKDSQELGERITNVQTNCQIETNQLKKDINGISSIDSKFLLIQNITKDNFNKKKKYYSNVYTIFDFSSATKITDSSPTYNSKTRYFTKPNNDEYQSIYITSEEMFEYFLENFNLYDTNHNLVSSGTYQITNSYYLYFGGGYYILESSIYSDETLQLFLTNNPTTDLYMIESPEYIPIEYYTSLFDYYINQLDYNLANTKTLIIDLGDYTNANSYNDFGAIDTNFIVNSDTLIQEVYNNFTIERINTVILANKKYWTCTSCGIIPSQLDSNTTEWIYCIFTNEHPNELDVNNFDMTNFNFITSRVLGVYSYTNNKSYFKTI